MCVVLAPLVVVVVTEAKLPPLPYLLALASAANVGGVISFSGNPQNMIVGAAAHGTISFAHYFILTLPIGVVCLAANAALLAWLFRFDLPRGALAERTAPRPEIDRPLAIKGLAALALFAVLALAGVALESAAMCAAALLMLASRTGARQAFALVDWTLLALFGGLFVVVAGRRARRGDARSRVFSAVAPVIDRGDLVGDLAFVVLIVIGAQIVSNVPLVLVAVAWVPHMHAPAWSYVVLAVASTLAGNLTLFGSIANIIVMWSPPACTATSGSGGSCGTAASCRAWTTCSRSRSSAASVCSACKATTLANRRVGVPREAPAQTIVDDPNGLGLVDRRKRRSADEQRGDRGQARLVADDHHTRGRGKRADRGDGGARRLAGSQPLHDLGSDRRVQAGHHELGGLDRAEQWARPHHRRLAIVPA